MARTKRTAGGNIHVWDYPDGDHRSYGGWHVTADKAGCATLAAGFDALTSAPVGTEQSFALVPPPAETLKHTGAPPEQARSAKKLVLVATSGKRKPWLVSEKDGAVTMEFDHVLIPVLRRQIERIGEGMDELGFGGSPGYEGYRQRLSLWRMPA